MAKVTPARLAKMVATPEDERHQLLRQYAVESKKEYLSDAEIWSRLLKSTAERLKKVDAAQGKLRLSYAKVRPVEIHYLDTDEVVSITTIPQLALVGNVYARNEITVHMRHIWIGRVFPQAKTIVRKPREL